MCQMVMFHFQIIMVPGDISLFHNSSHKILVYLIIILFNIFIPLIFIIKKIIYTDASSQINLIIYIQLYLMSPAFLRNLFITTAPIFNHHFNSILLLI